MGVGDAMTRLAPTLQAFFTDRLSAQLGASAHTVAAYRDTWRLLLGFTAARTHIPPARLDLTSLDAPLVGAFLDHLEHERGNNVRTRMPGRDPLPVHLRCSAPPGARRAYRPRAGHPAQTL
jgi:hypothetical protein